MLNAKKIRQDFPLLDRTVAGRKLVYFDNAATSQKPRVVITALTDFYQNHNANIHRGIHALAEEATALYENARSQVAKYIGAVSPEEVVFVRNTTEAVNLVAKSYGTRHVSTGDQITVTIAEHHSNFVPWQDLAEEKRAAFRVIDVDDGGQLKIRPGDFTKETKILALTQVSNVLGTINPVPTIVKRFKTEAPAGIVLLDGAQAVPHLPVNVVQLGCDFYAFSGHKMFGPNGIGVLWGNKSLLTKMPPFMTGGGMIKSVTTSQTEFAPVPERFEAGTPAIADAVGLAAAIRYLAGIGIKDIAEYETGLVDQLLAGLAKIPEATVYGPKTAAGRVGTVSFTVAGIHPHDIAQFLNDRYGIAVRAGHHCAMPLHTRLGIPASARVSLAFYNTAEEVDLFVKAIAELIQAFS